MNASAISKFASIFLLCSVIACHEPSVPPPPPPHPAAVESARQPVTQVVQTFNLPYDQAWPAVVSAIKEQKLEIKIADMNSGKILTEWVDVEDELCGVYPRTGAKLACRVRFIVEMDPLSFRASSFTASYYEECHDRKSLNLECPDSNAERMLIELVEAMKQAVSTGL